MSFLGRSMSGSCFPLSFPHPVSFLVAISTAVRTLIGSGEWALGAAMVLPYVANTINDTDLLAIDGRIAPGPNDSMTKTEDTDGEPNRFLTCPTA
jgi:hypothetical protein